MKEPIAKHVGAFPRNAQKETNAAVPAPEHFAKMHPLRGSAIASSAKRLLFFLAYAFGADALFYALNRNVKRIVCFHSVLPRSVKLPGLACGLDNAEDEFRAIVRELGKRYRFSADVCDLKTLTITFDDGFANQYEVASRILKEEGNVPAVLFVAGNLIENDDPAKCLAVERALAWTTYAPENIVLPFAESRKPGAGASRMSAWNQVVRPLFAADAAGKGEKACAELDEIYPMACVLAALPSDYLRLRMTGLTKAQLDDLRARGWRIGWHSRTHFPLKALSPAEQRNELASDSVFRREVLAYPYGDADNVSRETVRIAAELGYPCAVSFREDPVEMCGRHFMPRFFVQADKYALHFALSGLRHFLKTGRLLPNGWGV